VSDEEQRVRWVQAFDGTAINVAHVATIGLDCTHDAWRILADVPNVTVGMVLLEASDGVSSPEVAAVFATLVARLMHSHEPAVTIGELLRKVRDDAS
jgi:hypothetical protein